MMRMMVASPLLAPESASISSGSAKNLLGLLIEAASSSANTLVVKLRHTDTARAPIIVNLINRRFIEAKLLRLVRDAILNTNAYLT